MKYLIYYEMDEDEYKDVTIEDLEAILKSLEPDPKEINWNKISKELLELGAKMSIAEVEEWVSKGLSKQKLEEIKKR
jgi:Ca2+-binding EF-hand superfamily protein